MVNDDTSRNSFLNRRMRHRPFNLFCCDFQIFKIVEQFNLTTDSMISYDDSTQLTTEFYYVVYDCYTGCNLNCYHRFKIMFLTLEPVITTEYFRRNKNIRTIKLAVIFNSKVTHKSLNSRKITQQFLFLEQRNIEFIKQLLKTQFSTSQAKTDPGFVQYAAYLLKPYLIFDSRSRYRTKYRDQTVEYFNIEQNFFDVIFVRT